MLSTRGREVDPQGSHTIAAFQSAGFVWFTDNRTMRHKNKVLVLYSPDTETFTRTVLKPEKKSANVHF